MTDGRLPTTMRLALVGSGVLGLLALSVFEPLVAVGGVVGFGLAVVLAQFDGGDGLLGLATALLPSAIVGAIGVVALTGTIPAGVVVASGLVVAVSVGLLTVRPSAAALERAGTGALYAALVAVVVAITTALVATTEPALTPLEVLTLRWLTGDGFVGLLVLVLGAGCAVAAAVFAVPPAAVVTPPERATYLELRRALLWMVVIGTGATSVFVFFVTALSAVIVPLEVLVNTLLDSTLVRTLFSLLALGGVLIAVFGGVIRQVWFHADGTENPIVVVLVGAVGGVVVPFAGLLLVEYPTELVGGLFGATALVLLGGWVASVTVLESLEEARYGSVVALALVSGGVTVALTLETLTLTREVALVSAVSLVTIAAGVATYDLSRYGRTLSRAIGATGAHRRPQSVRTAWSWSIAAVGVVVAFGGLFGAVAVAPTTAVPAMVGVAVALGTLVVAIWALR